MRDKSRLVGHGWAGQFLAGATTTELARQEGCTHQNISRGLRQIGVLRSDGGLAARKRARLDAHRRRAAERHFKRFGMTAEELTAISPLPRRDKNHPIRIWKTFRNSAIRFGRGCEITFAQWWSVWQASGKWHLRGRGRDAYWMVRKDKLKPFRPDNMEVVNCADAVRELRMSEALSASNLSRPKKDNRKGRSFTWRRPA